MTFLLPIQTKNVTLTSLLESNFILSATSRVVGNHNSYLKFNGSKNRRNPSFSVSCSVPKIVRNPSLDKHVVRQNRIRFVQKLKTLLLSKPKHFIPIHILSKCRSYLCLEKPRSILSMIHRYPSIFELFRIPTPHTPFNATKSCSQLCVRLTPAAATLAKKESDFKSTISITLATKLQKLLMLSSHRRLLLSKLIHVAPDLGLPPNFRSRLCNDHPDKFKTVDTSYGRALELILWDPNLAKPLFSPKVPSLGLIVDRPLKFKHLRLRKGLNLRRPHREFLIKFEQIPDVCPYRTPLNVLAKESIEAEKRACAVVREVLAMMVEKRTLIDHLTHFRKEFGLPNKLRGLLVRHPEMFYVSLKGQRDSVFLLEGFDDKGSLLEKDETLVLKDQFMELVRECKKKRRERRINGINYNTAQVRDDPENDNDDVDNDYDDGFENFFELEDSPFGDDIDNDDKLIDLLSNRNGEFWTADAYLEQMEPW